ncbi:MAG TPA: DUF1572 family protein [Vicinamibacterales bacterium]|nr:DUF1572 family protein [Vicinamibacterales bacterium]
MAIEGDFLRTAAEKLAENLERIETCVPKLPADSLWARASENENAVGNLLLHLDGNVRQWILSGIAGAPDTRDRPSEFGARSGVTAEAMLTSLRGTVGEAVEVIRSLPHRRLTETVRIQGYDATVLSAIFHVVEHFSGHTYQIILLTKRATGEDLGFYRDLADTGRRASDSGEAMRIGAGPGTKDGRSTKDQAPRTKSVAVIEHRSTTPPADVRASGTPARR